MLQAANLEVGGRPDILTVDRGSDSVSVLLSRGDGTFRPGADYPAGVDLTGIAVGDYTGDGNLIVLLGNGDGTFRVGETVPNFTSGNLLAPDLNGDGRADLLVGSYLWTALLSAPPPPGDINDDGHITVADATLALRASVQLITLTPAQMKVADLDGDGVVDIRDATRILRQAIGL